MVGLPGVRTARAALLTAAASGDWDTAISSVAPLLEGGAAQGEILNQLLLPTQVEAGARWHANRWGVVEERLCTAACESILTLVEASHGRRPTDKGHLVIACVEGEHHSFPARAAACDLRELGWRVTFAGADVPADQLRSFLAAERPDAALLSCTLPANLTGAQRSVRAAHDLGLPVLVGGAAFGRDQQRAECVGADAWATTAHAAGDLLDGVLGAAARPRIRALGDDPARQAQRLAATAPLLARIAAGALGALIGTDRALGAEPWAQNILRTLAASLLAGEEQLVHEDVDWVVEHATARGESPHTVVSLLSAVATALPESFGSERHTLQSAIDRLALQLADSGPSSAPLPPRTPGPSDPSPANETARLAALATHVDQSSPPDRHFTELVHLAAAVCEAPIAFVSFIDADSQRLWAQAGEAPHMIPRGESICARTILQPHPVIVSDLAAHPYFAATPLVANEPRWRFYAGIPIVVGGGFAIGTLAVVDFSPRTLLSTQTGVLKALANEVALHLEVDRFRAERIGDPHRSDEDRMTRLMAQVVDVRATEEGLPETLLSTQTGVLKALANEVALHLEVDRFRAERIGDPHRSDEDRMTRLMAQVVDVRATEEGLPERLLSTRDVARLFGVSTRTVANWATSGQLQPVRTAGGHYRFLIDRVLELLMERDVDPGPVELQPEPGDGQGRSVDPAAGDRA
ncbi:MAG: helix-turn-helix domain-containing protein [Actinobacteria bacterium]|nr:MAG: helix-turn-helix domain-containing protein [Actinomycetota bacterium]